MLETARPLFLSPFSPPGSHFSPYYSFRRGVYPPPLVRKGEGITQKDFERGKDRNPSVPARATEQRWRGRVALGRFLFASYLTWFALSLFSLVLRVRFRLTIFQAWLPSTSWSDWDSRTAENRHLSLGSSRDPGHPPRSVPRQSLLFQPLSPSPPSNFAPNSRALALRKCHGACQRLEITRRGKKLLDIGQSLALLVTRSACLPLTPL